jgi:hypothetical protein
MDILTQSEIDSINSSSDLVRKYSESVDRESAYEILGRKVSEVEKENADAAAQKQYEKEQRSDSMSQGRTSRSPQNEVVKVLTSATFIRGVFGILKKVMK